MRRSIRGVSLVVAVLAPLSPATSQSPPSVVVIVMDDVGIEHLSLYDLGLEGFANTEDLDEWEEFFLRFDDAWSNAECSPTRATLHTGKLGHSTGVGRVINCDDSRQMDVESGDLLPKKLPGSYVKAAFGKWHLGTDDGSFTSECDGLDAPIVAGYDLFEGLILDQQDKEEDEPYVNYVKTTIDDPAVDCPDPNTPVTGGYQTRDIGDSAVAWIEDQLAAETPYFAWVAFTAAHEPFHCPPQDLYPEVDFVCDENTTDLRTLYRDMITALSVDIDRVVSAAAGIDPGATPSNPENTLVILVGDNGSPSAVVADPVDGSKAKGTVFQGGVRVPFFLWGDLVTNGVAEEGEIVGAIDLYATILETVGATYTPFDSVDLSAYFTDDAAGVREYLYTEWFYPNFDPTTDEGPSLGQQAIRDTRYKYVRTMSGQEGFFDLDPNEDPWEEDNLLPLSSEDPLAPTLLDLKQEMNAILPGGLESICELEEVGDFCDENSDCCSRACHVAENECVNPITPPSCPPS